MNRIHKKESGYENFHNGNNHQAKTNGSTLYWFDELPKILQYNKYIRSGYRAGLSRKQCLCSIGQYHNETGNIWSHLLPACTLLLSLVFRWLQPWPKAQLAFWENITPSIFCMGASVTYHTLMADHHNYKRYLNVDVCGVFLVLVLGAGSGISWGLKCYPIVRNGFLITYYTTAAACAIAGVRASSRLGRVGPMLFLLAVRGASLTVRLLLQTGSRAACWYYMLMEAAGISGAVINLLRIPEKWLFPSGGPPPNWRKPGPFDIWLNSHQIMHILVLFAMIFKHLGTAADYSHVFDQPHSC